VARVALIARLKPGCEEQAAQLVAAGPPFDPGERGLTGHEVYLSAGEVVFLFEAPEVESSLDDMLVELGGILAPVLDAWREIVDGPPRIARPRYIWNASGD
jgi:hypothetical protein